MERRSKNDYRLNDRLSRTHISWVSWNRLVIVVERGERGGLLYFHQPQRRRWLKHDHWGQACTPVEVEREWTTHVKQLKIHQRCCLKGVHGACFIHWQILHGTSRLYYRELQRCELVCFETIMELFGSWDIESNESLTDKIAFYSSRNNDWFENMVLVVGIFWVVYSRFARANTFHYKQWFCETWIVTSSLDRKWCCIHSVFLLHLIHLNTPDLTLRLFFQFKSHCMMDVLYSWQEKLLLRPSTPEWCRPLIMMNLQLKSSGGWMTRKRYTLSIW